ncbi:carbohydrate-binding family 9-like protein [Carboxylicivirga marina]|uniref:Carbohydrate-binding domain-containing protein n=1 Tax=Carboxylicivirga marina TaxID=2800988 RepID=A0ABS1HN78_9BACT|nr:carbohydrate-binding family 9-like protein [Carboxylicivirga marina]MBK3519137.1 hypothetical protein [Carboxylicivirga marina]
MKKLEVAKVQHSNKGDILFPKVTNTISHDNWNYPVEMDVKFGIAYDDNNLYLRYEVMEDHPKAQSTVVNGPVWEDSCVEFFIAFDNKGYFNLEFNCIGNKLVGYGTSNTDRKWLNDDLVKTITTKPTLGTNCIDIANTPTKWSMDIIIPQAIFGEHKSLFTKGQVFNVNFYKCGDKQKEPHFLSWNAIENETPNFHLPAFFGSMELI